MRADRVEKPATGPRARVGLLTTLPPEPRQRRLALGAVAVSIAIFAALASFAKTPLPPVAPFLPIYQSAFVVNETITAVLLYGQFAILRSPPLLVLASGYLLSALMAVSHLLSFPGLFAPTGLLGAGGQTTAWLYFLWHGAFPLFVIAYALLDRDRPAAGAVSGRVRVAVAGSVAVVLSVACGMTLLATAGRELLPVIMQGNRDAPAKVIVATVTWMLSLVAFATLWPRRTRSVLDLWLLVVMCAWLFDTALAAVLNGGRFDVGWYAGRVYGLLAGSFVLVVLLLENSALYARLARAHDSERRERERAQAAEAAAATADRAKSEFLSRMSHELRTPLNGILGFAQLLEMDATAQGERESVGHILKGGRHLLSLIDEILDLARIEAGRLPLSLEPVAVDDAVASALDLVRPQAAARRIALRYDGTRGAGYVTADAQRLRQVLLNLLSNAVKYNREGGTVDVECAAAPAGRVAIAVRDTGDGIPAESLGRLFTPFERLAADTTGVQGTGLGLALSRRLVEAMGGALRVESRVGIGTTFTVELAGAETPATGLPAATAERRDSGDASLRGTVLYVEDNAANLRLFERVMARRPGVSLLSAMSGRGGLEQARAHRPDLIVLDLHLPDVSGRVVLEELRGDPATATIPVVVLSADATAGQISRMLAEGAHAYLTKPLDVKELLTVVDNVLGRRMPPTGGGGAA